MTDEPSLLLPLVYQLNTRISLAELAAARTGASPEAATLDHLPDTLVERAAAQGFSWLWPLGVWQTGEIGRRLSREPEALARYRADLTDVRQEDVCGSPFAITGYEVNRDFGGGPALARLRERMRRLGQRLMLDFVPNHVALDHPWVAAHPEYFVEGSEDDLRREPGSWVRLPTSRGPRILAHGRDPYFPPWTDTLQLDHRHAGLRAALIGELERVAERCDGVRCDMAMLLLPEVFARVWGERGRPSDGTPPCDRPFWPEAIDRVRRRHPDFRFVAEVYWGLEAELQEQGFDDTYDKELTDRLRDGGARAVRDQLGAAPVANGRGVHFLENHDEARAAAAFPAGRHRAAAVIAYLGPGVRLFHEGQLEGRRRHASIQLTRRAPEAIDLELRGFYDRLLACLRRPEVHRGVCRLGTSSCEAFVVLGWQDDERRLLVAVNFGDAPARGNVSVAFSGLAEGARPRLVQVLGDAPGEPGASTLGPSGVDLELPAWGYRAFEVGPERP